MKLESEVVRLKYVSGFIVGIALCIVIWIVYPAKEQVTQSEKVSILEEQIGSYYKNFNNNNVKKVQHYFFTI